VGFRVGRRARGEKPFARPLGQGFFNIRKKSPIVKSSFLRSKFHLSPRARHRKNKIPRPGPKKKSFDQNFPPWVIAGAGCEGLDGSSFIVFKKVSFLFCFSSKGRSFGYVFSYKCLAILIPCSEYCTRRAAGAAQCGDQPGADDPHSF